jgi:hypothetical protein
MFYLKYIYIKKSNCLRGNAERLTTHAKDPEGMKKGSQLMPRAQKASRQNHAKATRKWLEG